MEPYEEKYVNHAKAHITHMKASAAESAEKARKARRDFRRIAYGCFVWLALAWAIAALFEWQWPFVILSAVCSVPFGIIARVAWKDGERFHREWLELRETSLGYAKDAEDSLKDYI